MVIFLICILAAIIVIALYLMIHRVFLKRATMMVQKNAQDVTDAALNTSLKEMLHWNKNLNSQIVADVWGKGVLAFEYHFDYKKEKQKQAAFNGFIYCNIYFLNKCRLYYIGNSYLCINRFFRYSAVVGGFVFFGKL